MQRRTLMTGGVALALTGAGQAQAAAGPVVLELFTSQGCSSCPPADALLGELAKQPGVVALAWHVDYWNNLGWRDPFASAAWTDRQRAYAAALRDEVYTPALVVNGAAMVVGSDSYAVRKAMAAAPAAPVAVMLRRSAAGLDMEAANLPAGATALLVFYDPEHATAVAAGENSGRRLKEYRVVRAAREIAMSEGRAAAPDAPAGQGAALLVRDRAWRIIGAADLPPAPKVTG
jgi:hypothetical protein